MTTPLTILEGDVMDRLRQVNQGGADAFRNKPKPRTTMKPETLMIDDTKYIRADAVPETRGDIKIVVADRGFVYVGHIDESDPAFVKLTNAHNIRVWGTTKGLGELVKGPTSSTKLDRVGSIRIPARAVISIIDVEQESWKKL